MSAGMLEQAMGLAILVLGLVVFMAPHVRAISREREVTIVASSCSADVARLLGPTVSFTPTPIARQIAPIRDLRALVALWTLFRRRRFRIVQSITPKAGLLAMIAARLAGVPVRIHWFTGQVWATRTGAARWLLKTMDRVLVACATHVLADSPSQRTFLVKEGVVREGQVEVFGDGSLCGVDTARFRPDAGARARLRHSLRIPDDAIVVLYLGRLNDEKGVPDLARAFAAEARAESRLHLLIVGPSEVEMRHSLEALLGDVAGRTRFVDFTPEPEAYMAAADIFVLASRREGFGSSVIEAAACGVPAIGTRIYGLIDAIDDGVSGLLVEVGDVDGLSEAIRTLASRADLRADMGAAARERVQRLFRQEALTAALLQFHRRILEGRPS